MAKRSLNDVSLTINAESMEKLYQAEGLLRFALSSDLSNQSPLTIYEYLNVLYDLVFSIRKQTER